MKAAILVVVVLLAGCASTMADALATKAEGSHEAFGAEPALALDALVAALYAEGSGPVVVRDGVVVTEIGGGGLGAPPKMSIAAWVDPVEGGGARVTVRAPQVTLIPRDVEGNVLAAVRATLSSRSADAPPLVGPSR